MSQGTILKFLAKHKDTWFRSGQIARFIGVPNNYKKLQQLRRFGLVEFKEKKVKYNYLFLYKAK